MDSWEKFDETTLPPKEAFHSNLNLEDISNEDYVHAQNVWGVFETKNLGNITTYMFKVIHYVFENFRNECIEIYGLHPVYFVSAAGLA